MAGGDPTNPIYTMDVDSWRCVVRAGTRRLRPTLSRRAFVGLVLAGAFARIVGLPSAGTSDVTHFQVWAYNAATIGPTQLYGVGGWPPDSRLLEYAGETSNVDYPPVALYALASVGHVYGVFFPGFPSTTSFIVAIKLLATLGSVGLALAIGWIVGRRRGSGAGRLAAMAYWANPAVILHSAALGYIGTIAAVPAIAALVAANYRMAWTSGALLALAALTKPQGALVAPALALALAGGSRDWRWILMRAAGGAAVAAGVIMLPLVWAGSVGNMLYAIGGLVTDGTLSAQAANLWWIVGYLIRVARRFESMGFSALSVPSRIFGLEETLNLEPSILGTSAGALVLASIAWSSVVTLVGWAIWRARVRNDFTTTVALAALTVHAYFTLAVQVHENHLALSLPIVVLIAVDERAYRRLLVVLSTIVALNLNFFYGFDGDGTLALPRAATFIDATVLLSVANVCALVWHARLVAGRCSPAVTVRDAAPV